MGYKDRKWKHRYGLLGDEAEQEFVEWIEGEGLKAERFGINRAQINMAKIPAFIRHSPDFLMHDRLVECKGVGRDGLVKIKEEQVGAWEQWYLHFAVWLFVWDSHKREFWYGEIDTHLVKMIRSCEQARFEDNDKLYYEVPVLRLWGF